MKWLLISPFSSHSGSAIRFWHIAKHLSLAGHTVIYCERRQPNGPKPDAPRFEYHSTTTIPFLPLDLLISLIYNTILVIRNLDADIFYALKPAPNNCLPILFTKIFGKRVFLDIDDLDYGYYPKDSLKFRLSRFWFNAFPKHFELITCHTQKLFACITQTIRIPEAKVYFLAQGVSDEFLEYPVDPSTQREPKSIIYVATLGITSDFGDLIPVFTEVKKALSDFTVTVVGDGVRRSLFEEQIRIAGLASNVTFTGRIPHQQLPALMAKHQIGINYMRSSLTNDCRAILKIREYLALGLQVVCNDVGDALEFKEMCRVVTSLEAFKRELIQVLGEAQNSIVPYQSRLKEGLRWKRIIESFIQKSASLQTE
jgi:glycosyltransferase involved in cell wall biosynthesis